VRFLLAFMLGLCIIGCRREPTPIVAPERAPSTNTLKPLDPDLEATLSSEFRRNAAERERRESQLGDPLAEAKQSQGTTQELILHGKFAGTTNFVISLWRNRELVCTGSLIEPTIVVTAWHCLCSPRAPSVFAPLDEARIGPLGLVPIESIPINAVNPKTCPRDKTQPDLALLRLSRPPSASASIRYPKVLRDFPPQLPAIAVMGFGFREDRDRNRRDMAIVTMASRDCATAREQSAFGCLAKNEFVAVDPAGQVDACNGDSGGPALVPFSLFAIQQGIGTGKHKALKFAEPQYQLIGVVSRGLTPKCGSGTIYSKASTLPAAPR